MDIYHFHGRNLVAMAREKRIGFDKRPRRKLRIRKWRAHFSGCLLLAIGFGVPMVVQNRKLVVSLANRNAGLAPMRIDLESIEAGWFRPLKVRGLKLIDEHGAELVQVAEVETELSLLGIITNYKNLKTVTVRGAAVQLDVQPENHQSRTSVEAIFSRFSFDTFVGNSEVPAAQAVWPHSLVGSKSRTL